MGLSAGVLRMVELVSVYVQVVFVGEVVSDMSIMSISWCFRKSSSSSLRCARPLAFHRAMRLGFILCRGVLIYP